MLAAARGSRPVADALAEVEPGSPSAAVAAARGRDGVDLVLARSRGAEWLDDYVERWREVELEISGGFGHDTNAVTLLRPGAAPQGIALRDKRAIAAAVVDAIVEIRGGAPSAS